MKVLMIEPIGYSGICIYTAQLCGGLVKAGCDVSLVTSRLYDPKVMKPVYPFTAILGGCDREQPRALRALDYFLSWAGLSSVLRREKPDLIHLQNSLVPIVDLLVLTSLRLFGYPIFYTAHDVDRSAMMTKKKWRIRINRLIDAAVYRVVHRLIVHTASSGDELRNQFSIPIGKIRQVRHGNQAFHLDGFAIPSRADARQKLGLSSESFVVLFFGDRRPSKGLDLLIKAAARMKSQSEGIILLIAGERRILDTNDYQEIARQEGVITNCRFHDRFIAHEEVPVFFAAADITALPYRKIYQSGVVHLSFAFSRPVLAARVGGLAEIVEEGKTGFFVEDPENLEELTATLLKAYQRRDEIKAMGKAAQRVELEEYGWESIGEKTMKIYSELLKDK